MSRGPLEVVTQAFAALNRGDLDACTALLEPGFVMHHAGAAPVHGRQVWEHGVQAMRTAFPDLHVRVEDALEQGDRVALRVRLSGTHHGHFFGAPPTGGRIDYVSHEFYRVRDGLLAEEWICSDSATFARQLAGEAAPGGDGHAAHG
ncbi:ester cyclase [Kineococcus indalonis]|uniref:ester cyclase n=1 Tax=Kineococcus indalonis TaxID=2696566 RepID=UPI00196BA29F|nr:ester cyclase [Kineococcus indalonis]